VKPRLAAPPEPRRRSGTAPDDLMAGTRPRGHRVVLFDDDHYYMGGVLAELLATEGHDVQLVTPTPTSRPSAPITSSPTPTPPAKPNWQRTASSW